MPFRNRNIAREMGAAIAVVAIYILVLLAPLHQAAGLQRDLSHLGFASVDTWSICSPLASQTETGKIPVVVKCAAAGIGKNELALPALPVLHVWIKPDSIAADYVRAAELRPSSQYRSTGQPRAPPVA